MKRLKNGDKCKKEIKSAKSYRDEVPVIVDQLVASCSTGGCFDHVSAEPIPHREAIIDILHRLALILYPGYFIRTRLDSVNLEYYLGQQLIALYEHKVAALGALWHVNSFDQWGVEYGKQLANRLLPVIEGRQAPTGLDASTAGLVAWSAQRR